MTRRVETTEDLMNTPLMGEMGSAPLNTDIPTDVPAAGAGAEAVDDRKWFDTQGNEVSKSAFIREQFNVLNQSRKEIAEANDIPYRTVYGATVNMVNDAEPSTRGRGIVNSRIKVNAERQVLIESGEEYLLNGEPIAASNVHASQYTEVDRNTWIKEQVEAGVHRGDVAKYLGLSYGVVYGLTKEADGTRTKYEIEVDGVMVSRSEYIRQQIAAGKTKAEVAKELNVEYSVIWQATKQAKSADERFKAAVEVLAKFKDSVVEATDFQSILDALGTITLKAEATETEEATVTEDAN